MNQAKQLKHPERLGMHIGGTTQLRRIETLELPTWVRAIQVGFAVLVILYLLSMTVML